jgi:ribosomal protein S18 acetylase RimI-like enzyme
MHAPFPNREEMFLRKPTASPGDSIVVERGREADREAIGETTRRAGVFTAEEEKTVFELFDAHLKSADSGYEWFSARAGTRLAGFACYGPTPLAPGAFDLYWICTDPEFQGHGVGRSLFAAVEADIRGRDARLLIVWTSAAKKYLPANKFYERMGCECAARIRDYYQPGEDLVVYIKYFNQ